MILLLQIIIWSLIYNITVALSILYLGYVSRIFDEIGFNNIVSVIFNQYFIIGAALAFVSRLVFAVIDITIRKNGFVNTSTSVTFLISLTTIFSVLLINNIYLHEKLSYIQIIGVVVMIIGLSMVGIK